MGGDLTMVQNLNKQLQTKLGELEHENVNLRMALQVNKLQQVKEKNVHCPWIGKWSNTNV